MKVGKALVILGMLAVVTILILGCETLVGQDVAARALENQGYSHISITSTDWRSPSYRGCGKYDDVYFTANATNQAGRMVKVYVCARWP